MHNSEAADSQEVPATCSLNARHLVPECPLDGQGQTA